MSWLLTFLFLFGCSSTYLGRYIFWNRSGINDYQKFPSHRIQTEEPIFFFDKTDTPFPIDTVRYTYEKKKRSLLLEQLLEVTGTTAFLIIRNDTLLHETYMNGYTRSSINTSFSIAKSITSLLVGIAYREGHFNSLDDSIVSFLPELEETDKRYNQVTIKHLLNMRSGVRFRDHDLPWGDKPKAYYKPNLKEHILDLPVVEPPGSRFRYNSYNPAFLGLALERASGESIAGFTESRIWRHIGAEFEASWSIDSKKGNTTKMESGFNARAIDFAKLGRLVLNNGAVANHQILPVSWIDKKACLDPKYLVPGYDSSIFYCRGWWIHRPGPNSGVAFAGWGHLGQYLYLFPDQNLIIIRFGEKIGKIDSWPALFQSIVKLLNSQEVETSPTS